MKENNLVQKEKATRQNRVWVRISSVCNNRCVFCLDSDAHTGEFVNEDIVKEEIKNDFKSGYENRVILSGGEATINPKFPDYIKYAKEVGYNRVQTVTNGNMFAYPDFCKKVFEAGLEEITFSFHGHTSQLHDYLVGTPGAFKKSLTGLIYTKKYYPNVIVNVDIVVNKVNVVFLSDIVKFFMKLGVYEFDILQIIPFGRAFESHRDILFFKVSDYKEALKKTWELSKISGVYMWTNRFSVEAFEGYEELIQDPRKIKSEVMGEGLSMYTNFIHSGGEVKPSCFGEKCQHCFISQYCHDFLAHKNTHFQSKMVALIHEDSKKSEKKYFALRGEEFPSQVYEKFGENEAQFREFLISLDLHDDQEMLNVPLCLRTKNNTGKYEFYPDMRQGSDSIEEYTKHYIHNFYRKKSLRCSECKYDATCHGIHINFIRSYGFSLLKPIKEG